MAASGNSRRRRRRSVSAIVEESAASEEQRAIAEINSGIYAFTLTKAVAMSSAGVRPRKRAS